VNTLVASVGYTNLSDLSFGPSLMSRLKELAWPECVILEDLSFGPIAVMQQLEDAAGHFDRAVFIAGVPRGRKPGSLDVYRWSSSAFDAEEIRERINESVTGVISLDNLLTVCHFFHVLPPEVICVEAEPVSTGFGLTCSPAISSLMDAAIDVVRRDVVGIL
jgi:hydrogenase maturation protease